MGRKKRKSARQKVQLSVKIALWALLLSLISIGVNAVGLVREHFFSAYELRISTLGFTTTRIVGGPGDFVAEFEFVNSGTEPISVLDVVLRLPREGESGFHLISSVPLDVEPEARSFVLDPGEKRLRAYAFDWSRVDGSTMLTHMSAEYTAFPARLIVSVVNSLGRESTVFLGGVEIDLVEGDLIQSISFSPRTVLFKGDNEAGNAYRMIGAEERVEGQAP